eukprot:CAMPEP_0185306114 /NCGR_PEP_ID=MMETSP1363-20130426/15875_1 /TAXON_ID=38817 /ORGANISM="Gephyrocapsa oceanica, Strain RCC1303" /LENGTH=212 /DNA_ID=CAMNT_0027903385 /DNA_START=223 /DNA_END=859 /DNA_ORIENTATION=+
MSQHMETAWPGGNVDRQSVPLAAPVLLRVACWACRHPRGLVCRCSGAVAPRSRGRLQEPVSEGLQLETGVVRPADALEHAAAHAVQPDGPRGQGAEQRVVEAVHQERERRQAGQRGEHALGDGPSLREAGGAQHRVGGPGAAGRVDRPLVGRMRLRNVHELDARAAGKLARQGGERGRQAAERGSGEGAGDEERRRRAGARGAEPDGGGGGG